MVVASLKYKTWKDVPKNTNLSIGTTGLGVTSHLIALQIVNNYPKMLIVPFKSPSDSLLGIVNGSVDFGISFISEIESWSTKNRVGQLSILGITGSTQVKNYPLLYKQGFPKILSSLNNPQHLVIPLTVSDEKTQEWRSILVKAARADSVRRFYNIDSCIPLSDMPESEFANWFESQNNRWKNLTHNVNLNK
jgi:tripartite-type tricarboxylate transporter receptor subunit TctC